MEEEIENELELETDGPEFIPADTDESDEVGIFKNISYYENSTISFLRKVIVD